MTQIAQVDHVVILALEASGEQATVAVLRGAEVLAERHYDERHGQAGIFVSLVKTCLSEAGLDFQDVDVIAAGVGPGSFTGLRVCLAAAKGFVLAGNLPGVGISALRARAFAALRAGAPAPVIALADTRRGSYFYQQFDADCQPVGMIDEIAAQDIQKLAKRAPILMPPAPKEVPHDADLPAPVDMSARHIGLLAHRDLKDGAHLGALDPLYVAAPKLGPSKNG